MKSLSAIAWLETELSEIESEKNERSLSLHMDLISEAFRTAKELEKDNIEKAFRFSDSYHSFELFYKSEID
jgi:hypothetical protein